MYQEGKRIISHHKRHVILVWFAIILILLVVGGYFAAKHFLKADTAISKTEPTVGSVVAQGSATKPFSEKDFTFDLPKDWKFIGYTQDIYHAYSWENATADPGERRLVIYVDNIPTGLGVNRLLPLQAEGDKLSVGSLSDNCANFTGDKVPGNPATPAKWSGVNFLCDLSNYERNIIGTSSTGDINSVTLTGSMTGKHAFFFTYTDNSSEPDYNIFTSALQSFMVK